MRKAILSLGAYRNRGDPDGGAGGGEDKGGCGFLLGADGGGGVPEFLSTHPSHASRIRDPREELPRAKAAAAGFGGGF